jgi:hypothetical protein
MSDIVKNNLNLFVFQAIDEPELCDQYSLGHIKVLRDYGIENVTTNNNSWMNNPHTYCVVARYSNSKELIGGVRIQIADGIHPLPVEEAIGYLDKTIHEKVNHYAINGGIGESCGLWVAKEVKGMNIARYLMWASVSSANQLNFSTMLGICAGYTLKLFGEIGFVIDKSLGNQGDFPYPNSDYIAHVIGILNALTLDTTTKTDKDIMLILRKSPIQVKVEKNKRFESTISYNLKYESISKINYQPVEKIADAQKK